jgi:hypothetical protein
MVAYSFRSRFIEPIIAGTKCQTIRGDRKSRHVQPGGQMQLYCGMRTRECQAIGVATCQHVVPIVIEPGASFIVIEGFAYSTWEELDQIARCDGFRDWTEMKRFWHDLYPDVREFKGVLIRWRDFVAATKVTSATDN